MPLLLMFLMKAVRIQNCYTTTVVLYRYTVVAKGERKGRGGTSEPPNGWKILLDGWKARLLSIGELMMLAIECLLHCSVAALWITAIHPREPTEYN